MGAEYAGQAEESTALYVFEIRADALWPVEDEELLDTLLEIFSLLSEEEE